MRAKRHVSIGLDVQAIQPDFTLLDAVTDESCCYLIQALIRANKAYGKSHCIYFRTEVSAHFQSERQP